MTDEELSLWTEWRNHLVTQALMAAFNSRINEATEYLQEQAGVDPNKDRYLSGYIAAARDFVQAKPETE